MFTIKVRASNAKDSRRAFEGVFRVEIGAHYSSIPEDLLEGIGVEPVAMRNLVLADGRQEIRKLGYCDLQIEGIDGVIPCPVMFSPKGSPLRLGATALNNFGVELDLIEKKLKPIRVIIASVAAPTPATAMAISQSGRPAPPPLLRR